MEKQDIINEFTKIADEFGLKLEVDEHSDGSYVDVSLVGTILRPSGRRWIPFTVFSVVH